jgi:hypothetical protein
MKWFALLGLVLFLGGAVATTISVYVNEHEEVISITGEAPQYQPVIGKTTISHKYLDASSSNKTVDRVGVLRQNEQMDYDLSIIFVYIVGTVKNVRFEPYNMNLRLFFDIVDVTITGFFSWDWNEWYSETYTLNESNWGLGIRYYGMNKVRAYVFPNTVQYLCGIMTSGRIVR